MRIDYLELENFKCFDNLQSNFKPGINLFIGINGSGKTALLEGVRIATSAFFANSDYKENFEPIPYSYIKISNGLRKEFCQYNARFKYINWSRKIKETTNSNDSKHVKSISEYYSQNILTNINFENLKNKSKLPLLVNFSTQRLFVESNKVKAKSIDDKRGRINGFRECLSLKSINTELVEWWGLDSTSEANSKTNNINRDFNTLRIIKILLGKAFSFLEGINTEVIVYYEPKDKQTYCRLGENNFIPLSEYSDGFRNVIFLFLDLIWRASTLNPWLTIEDISEETVGVVIIDEIDLHLHPKWQSKIIPALQAIFPNVQFFITTHSPIVVGSFEAREEKDAVYLISNQELEILPGDFYGYDINTVLGNPFQTANRAPEVEKSIQKLLALLRSSENLQRINEIDELFNKLSESLPTEDEEMGLIRAMYYSLDR